MSWWGWGDPARAAPLSPELRELVRTALGARADRPHPDSIDAVPLPPPALAGETLDRLIAAVGDEHVLTDTASRVRHTRGKSTPDLLRLRADDFTDAPDAVLLPGSHEEIECVLGLCAEDRIGVIPFGGGSSVVGGLTARRTGLAGVIALDLRRLRRLLEIDEISRTATLEPGLRGPEAEALLGERGYTLGHFPQSFEYATLGGFAAARSSGQASAGYGRFDDLIVSLRVATPQGTVELGRAPKSAAGPDLRQLFLGSEGAFGVITALTAIIRPRPEARVYEGWRFSSFDEGAAALRRLAQDGPLPTVLRLSDEVETALNLARPAEIASNTADGCLAVTGYEGSSAVVQERRSAVSAILRGLGATAEPEAGPAWEHGRYSAPYLRDALLDAGAIVETLETATFWSRLPALYVAVRDALSANLSDQGTPAVVLCHISHVYAAGASLYFTVACAQGDDPLGQWQRAKTAACDAILCAGGTITHHHGVGSDHRPWFERQIGELGIDALRAVKRTLDPNGIMNPGVLVA